MKLSDAELAEWEERIRIDEAHGDGFFSQFSAWDIRDLLDTIAELKAENAKLRAWAESTRMRHYYCEDSWYSCPNAEEGCADEREGPECNCGADKHNAKLDALLKGSEG